MMFYVISFMPTMSHHFTGRSISAYTSDHGIVTNYLLRTHKPPVKFVLPHLFVLLLSTLALRLYLLPKLLQFRKFRPGRYCCAVMR